MVLWKKPHRRTCTCSRGAEQTLAACLRAVACDQIDWHVRLRERVSTMVLACVYVCLSTMVLACVCVCVRARARVRVSQV